MPVPELSGYTLHECQGSGTFGSVFRSDWDGRLQCAVKVLNPTGIHPAYLSWCLEKLREEERHPNIVPVLGFDLAHQPAYVSCAWVAKSEDGPRTLWEAIGKWNLPQNVQALMTLARALAWLHKRGIIHTGLTASNVLLLSDDPADLMVSDTGQGLIEASQNAGWGRHAPYFSPERCRFEPPHGESSGEAWDVYAFGVIGFQLLTGKFPRAANLFQEVTEKGGLKSSQPVDLPALAGRLESEAVLNWPETADNSPEQAIRRVIERCLALQPEARYPHMTDVLSALESISPASASQPSQQESPKISPRTIAASSRSARKLKTKPAVVPSSAETEPEPIQKFEPPQSPAEPQPLQPPAKPEALQPSEKPESLQPTSKPEAPQPPAEPDALQELIKHEKEPQLIEEPDESEQPVESKAPAWNTSTSSLKIPRPTPKIPLFPRPDSSKVAWISSAAAVAASIVAFLHFRQAQNLRLDLVELQSANAKAQQQALASDAEAIRHEQLSQASIKEQQRLQRNLLQEQEMSDQLLATLLDQRPTDDDMLAEQWRNRLGEYAAQAQERLKTMGSDPALLESSARTRWNMASINLALGDRKVAEGWLDEALRDVDAAAAATADKTLHANWDLLAGRILSRHGEISLLQHKYAEAAQQLNQANKSLATFLEIHPDDVLAQREHARSALLEGRTLLAKPDPNAALQILLKATDLANTVTFSPAQRDEDIFLLVDAYHELGRCQVALKNDEAALKNFLEPLQKLRTYDRDHPKSPDSRQRLASSYIEMGRVLGRIGNAAEASQALNQGIRILLELIIEFPQNEQYAFLAGIAYGEVSRLVSSSGKPSEAITFAQSAVQYLHLLTEKNRIEPQYRLHYAAELTNLSEIQESISHFPEAVKSGLNAVSLLDELTTEGGLASADRSVAQSCLARIESSLGRSFENLKQKDEAVGWYSKAIASWQKVAAEGNKDEKVQKSLSWTQDQLKRLQP